MNPKLPQYEGAELTTRSNFRPVRTKCRTLPAQREDIDDYCNAYDTEYYFNFVC
jgi:hypothetical protein